MTGSSPETWAAGTAARARRRRAAPLGARLFGGEPIGAVDDPRAGDSTPAENGAAPSLSSSSSPDALITDRAVLFAGVDDETWLRARRPCGELIGAAGGPRGGVDGAEPSLSSSSFYAGAKGAAAALCFVCAIADDRALVTGVPDRSGKLLAASGVGVCIRSSPLSSALREAAGIKGAGAALRFACAVAGIRALVTGVPDRSGLLAASGVGVISWSPPRRDLPAERLPK